MIHEKTHERIWDFPIDRGGRRQIKDRRIEAAAMQIPSHRTGLKRRSGRDRRYKKINGRMGGSYV